MSNKKAVNFFGTLLSLALRVSIELGIESDCQFSALMENDLNLVHHRFILKLLTSKSLLYHQKFKGALNIVLTETPTFSVAYPTFCLRRYPYIFQTKYDCSF